MQNALKQVFYLYSSLLRVIFSTGSAVMKYHKTAHFGCLLYLTEYVGHLGPTALTMHKLNLSLA